MNILLVVSPNFSIKMLEEEIGNLKSGTVDFTKSVDWRPAPPLGILYIASSLRAAGHTVTIYDVHRQFYHCRVSGYFSKHDLNDFFTDYFISQITNDIDIVGIGSLFNVSSSSVAKLAQSVKSARPELPVVVGGHYPTNMYADVLAGKSADYVILGEAEEAFVWLLEHLGNPVAIDGNPHIVTSRTVDKTDRKPALIHDLDSLPSPAWDILPHNEEYITNSIDADRVGSNLSSSTVKTGSLFTTRGCPMHCTFCAAHKVHGRRVRYHSTDYLMKQIEWFVSNFDINNLLIQDDSFNHNRTKAIEFCDRLHEVYGDRFNMEFPNGLAVWKLDEVLITKFKRAGLHSITIAVESGNEYVQKHLLKKNLNLSKIKEKVALLKKYNIGVRAFYIVGFVGETLSMMEETIQFALDLDIDWSEIKVFTPLVGSEMYEMAEELGYLTGDTSEHVYGRSSLSTAEFTAEQVKAVQYDGNIRVNFINNRFLRTRQYDRAEKVFRGLLKSFPGHIFAQWGLWQALEGQEKAGECRVALEELKVLAGNSEKNTQLVKKYGISL